MTRMQAVDVRAIVAETLAEQQRVGRDDIDAMVLKAITTTLTSFGIDEDDRKELVPAPFYPAAPQTSQQLRDDSPIAAPAFVRLVL
jgi:hypothetical protein